MRESVSESVRESALPWDTVPTTRFRSGKPLDTTIENLTTAYVERAKDDPNFQYQMNLIRDAEEISSRKTLSLNLEARRNERKEQLERRLQLENERRVALQLEPLESLEDMDDGDLPDIQLDQAAAIVTDLATLREVATKPEQTAQVHP